MARKASTTVAAVQPLNTDLCRACSSSNLTTFYEAKCVPVNSCILFDDEAAAKRYPTGEIALALCSDCGFISNVKFDPERVRYDEAYEEQQSFSPLFNAFVEKLALDLINRHKLRNKTVLEIGCGKGDFLMLLCRLGDNNGIGVDPTYVPRQNNWGGTGQIIFIQDFYTKRYSYLEPDMVCCRHTLEHIPDAANFLRTVRDAVGCKTDTAIFFEVPDVLRVLKESAFWDIYYEHCSYFSLGSLTRLFRRVGFDVQRVGKEYDGQYLALEARPCVSTSFERLNEEDDLDELKRAVAQFCEKCERKIADWRQRIAQMGGSGRRVAIWGSGSKCVAFLNALDIGDDIGAIVDVNPYRHNKCLPGSGKRIVAPERLKEYRPDVVIVMNPIYLAEIRGSLSHMGLYPELTTV
jgi:SAM-dependent methyltransferase